MVGFQDVETEALRGAANSAHRQKPSAVAREALEHMDSLYHFARYLSGSATEAEDLMQETYARALGAESSFVSGTNMRAWLFRILRNAFIDRQRRRKQLYTVDTDAEATSEQAAFPREPLRGDVEMEALRSTVADDIERALGALSTDARAAVLLDLEGFTEAEVANVLGCAPGTVKSRLARARQALRQLLSEYRR
jgi:RNA polymerase sigma-70 factor (ECF subfamily)